MNSIVHFELPAKDQERFKKFYSEIFGWHMDPAPEMKYTMVHTTEVDAKKVGAINGGMMDINDNGGAFPVLVIDVPNVDEYAKKIEEAGGTIVMPKTKVGDMGYYARFKDPEGVIMGIWEAIPRS